MERPQVFEFGAREWTQSVLKTVERLLDGVDLANIEYAFSEAYLNAPPDIAAAGGGWHFKVSAGLLTLGPSPVDDADLTIEADYETLRPLASVAFEGNPEAQSRVLAAAKDAISRGLLKVRGRRSPESVFPQLAPLHDIVAGFTAA